MDTLERQFEEEIKNNVYRSKKECKYNPTRFNQMIMEYGTLGAVKKLIRNSIETGKISDGLVTLVLCERLDLSVEHSVAKDKYAPLFTEEEIKYCERIIKYDIQ